MVLGVIKNLVYKNVCLGWRRKRMAEKWYYFRMPTTEAVVILLPILTSILNIYVGFDVLAQ